jgi:hypothetical protein
MFKLSTAPASAYYWPVKATIPGTSNTDPVTVEFDAQFKRLTKTQVAAIDKAAASDIDAFVREVMVGWRGVADDNDTPLPFLPENLATLLDIPQLGLAIYGAFYESLSGRVRGN